MIVFRIPEMVQKLVNLFPEWVAGLNRNQWQVNSGMGGSFEPESAVTNMVTNHYFEERCPTLIILM